MKSERASLRVATVRAMREVMNDLKVSMQNWTYHAQTTVYVPLDQRRPGHLDEYQRERQQHEYPENSVAAWGQLYNDIERQMARLQELKRFVVLNSHVVAEANAKAAQQEVQS